ncbi:MAG: FtsX-like permease family protein, partial [Candidatus Cloacimonetes bacterium]|nr:FtsX-like permease family protein [Candidatus Cloacimonadota bacterium]
DDPLNQPLNIRFIPDAYVAGIVEKPPRNSHIQFDAIIPLDTQLNPVWWDSWENLALTGYIRIREDADPAEVGRKIVSSARDGGFSEVFTPQMQPIKEMHLGSQDIRYDAVNFGKSSKSVVYGLILIGILVLLVATINFINLSSARATRRAREVGIRKVVGARKLNLSIQFFVESVLMTILAMLIAIGMLEISTSLLVAFLNRSLNIVIIHDPVYLLLFLGGAVLVGIISGIYPSLILTRFNSVQVLKGELSNGRSGILMRKILVISQFAVSIGLIISVMIVMQQIKYMQRVDFGYERDQVLVIPAFDNRITPGNDTFRQQIDQLPEVIHSGRINRMPGQTLPTTEVCFDFRESEVGSMFDEIHIDEGLIAALDIKIIKGRNFSPAFPSDSAAVLINENAFRQSGWDDIEGHQLIIRGEDEQDIPWQVIGVCNDINFGMAQRVIEPMVIKYNPVGSGLVMIKKNTADQESLLAKIEEIYNQTFPDNQFRHFYFDDIFSRQFQNENDFALKIGTFAILAIIIACLGLFGLASFSTENRRREIALRKVLGSSVKGIVRLLVMDFCKLVIFANILAWPIAWYVMKYWLQNFAYRTRIGIGYFFLAGITALVIAILTVGFRTFKAAYLNPATTLKYE